MPVCSWMSHVHSGLPLWPLVPMLALSLTSPLCSPGLFDSLAQVGLLGPCWCHLQGYEGVSGVHPTEDVGLHGRQLHHTTYVVPTGTPMCRQDQASLQVL